MASDDDELVLYDEAATPSKALVRPVDVSVKSAPQLPLSDDDVLSLSPVKSAPPQPHDDDVLSLSPVKPKEKKQPKKAKTVVAADDDDLEGNYFSAAVFQVDDEAPREAHGDRLPQDLEMERLLLHHDLLRDYLTPTIGKHARTQNDRSVLLFEKSLRDKTLSKEELELRQRIWAHYQDKVAELEEMSAVSLSKSVSNFYDEDSRPQRFAAQNDEDDDGDEDDIAAAPAPRPAARPKRAPNHFIREPAIRVDTVKPVPAEVSSVLKDTFARLSDQDDDAPDQLYLALIKGQGDEAVPEEPSDDGLDKRRKIENPFIMQVEEGSEEEQDEDEQEEDDDKGKEEDDDE